ncbi:MAG TPA: FTR1 family protein [Gemmatimonadales bacterium]
MILNHRFSLYMLFAPLAWLAGAAPSLAAQANDTTVARRIAAVTSIALTEYRGGVADGKVIAASEVEEARLFVADARGKAGELSPGLRARVMPWLDSLAAGVTAHRPAADLAIPAAALRAALVSAVGPNLDPLPDAPPSLAKGRAIYQSTCASCHGPLGKGDGPAGKGLTPPPANLTDPALGDQTPLDFLRKVTVGVAGTAMPSFEGTLSQEDRWAAAYFASGLRFSDSGRAAGRPSIASCRECQVALSDGAVTAELSDDSLRVLLAGWLASDGAARLALPYARTAAAEEELGGDRRLQAARVIDRARARFATASALAGRGSRDKAGAVAMDGYLEFERIETAVSARDAKLTKDVERTFAAWRSSLVSDSAASVGERQAALDSALTAALAPLIGSTTAPVLFSQSLIIMVREGLEAMLIVAALTALLAKAGAPEKKKEIGWGVLAALLASLGTAALLAAAIRHSAAQREGLEGVTMLVAALVLFWVSYWLVSKMEIKKWQAFVGQQLKKAVSQGGGFALAAVAFLAVYREGFETVLFYAALFAAADGVPAGTSAIAAGIGLGFGILCVVYVIIQRYGMRLPLKPFFAVTSALLYTMAFSFAGQGIADLQEAGWVGTTTLPWAPSVPVLGIFPTLQALLVQTLLLGAVLLALAWVFWLAPRREAAAA